MARHHHRNRSSTQLPQYLWRVQFPSCNTTWNDEGLFAIDHINSPITKDYLSDYLRSIEEHYLRDERMPTPYISLFSHREHAELWALKLPSDEIHLLQISVRKLLHSPKSRKKSSSSSSSPSDRPQILPLPALLSSLPIPPPPSKHPGQNYIDSAFLIPHHIPAHAIVDVRTRPQIEMGAFDTFFNYVCVDVGGSEDSAARSFLYSILARAEITTGLGEAIELLGVQREYERLVGAGDRKGSDAQARKGQDMIFSMMARAKVTLTMGEVLKMLALVGEVGE
ncbi:hypothetical protein M409DRAFT_20175 [Zasmidium cellare ATCC 36951]|uniref:DUF7587 domain-containing protein n=1 Tax=Zasmidium cellare ATCC 36951 TaxID=1080233 RepID=A0A6A6CUB4_ZASCE|nr:uncharacterized protein M409DRAFT_20175 [Zasmidium cellare ATCC 36951]KAF2169760.1 hypothetical protein M409DRAFT_20175 [Zasmidium cellare ATCC 36951]